MLKKFEELLPDLEDLSVKMELFNETFKLIAEGCECGASEIPRNALTLPGMMIDDMSKELNSIYNQMHQARSHHNG